MKRVGAFFLATFGVRVAHAMASLAFHVDGDVAIPWLMANDWEHALHRRFYWGQDYLGTYETFAMAKVGHAIFPGTIPLAFTVIAGQLEYAIGMTLLFAAVRRLRPGFGDRARELALAVAVLGFLPPALEKYSFGPGMGFSPVPLATGLAVWLWAAAAPEPVFACAGLAFGLLLTASRLSVIPVLALLGCLLLARDWRRLAVLAAGLAAGFAPEFALGLERSAHHRPSLFPLVERWHNLANALSQTGISFGILPVAVRAPEDTLFFRAQAQGAAPTHPWLDALATIAFLALAWATRRRWRGDRRAWIFAAIVAVSFAVIAGDGMAVDQAAARRYSTALSLSLGAWLLICGRDRLVKGLTLVRLGMLAVYLAASVTYVSPFGNMREILARAGFRPDTDCLSGHGGDLTAALAFSGETSKVVAYGWRLPGNYSRAVAPESCARIFHIDTGAVPVGQAHCPKPEPVYIEPAQPRHRPPLTIYRCG